MGYIINEFKILPATFIYEFCIKFMIMKLISNNVRIIYIDYCVLNSGTFHVFSGFLSYKTFNRKQKKTTRPTIYIVLSKNENNE